MKLRLSIIVAASLALFLPDSSANAGYLDPDQGWKNITTYDGLSGSYGSQTNTWWNTNEDQEVEPGAATGQQWDLEGFFLNDDTDELAMVGGFNFKDGQGGILSGDIFIDTDMDPSYYEYVLDLGFTDDKGNKGKGGKKKKYTVYENDEDNPITFNLTHGGPTGPTQDQNWTYSGGGSVVTGYQNLALTYLRNKNDKKMGGGVTGGKHNAVIVDVSFLGTNTGYDIFSTLECGNDMLKGGTSGAVPEPATIFLLGSGLLGFFGYRKKFRKPKN
jgi:hypothetical protein